MTHDHTQHPSDELAGSPSAGGRVRYRWGVLTDLHLAGAESKPSRWHNYIPLADTHRIFRRALTRLADEHVDRMILLGDLAEVPTATDYEFFFDWLAEVGVPAWVVPGNHDRPDNTPNGLDALLMGHHDVASTPYASAISQLAPVTVTTGSLLAHPGPTESYSLDFNPPRATGGQLLVVLTHYPILDVTTQLREADLNDAGNLRNQRQVATTLTNWPGPVLVLHGHQHTRTNTTTANVLQLGFGALAEQPHDTAVLDIDIGHLEDDLIIRVVRTSQPLAEPPRGWKPSLLDPPCVACTWNGRTWTRS